MKTKYILSVCLLALLQVLVVSCEKVSPQGVLMGNTGVDDRVKMSFSYFYQNRGDAYHESVAAGKEYTFLVGSDSHLAQDIIRMNEFFDNMLDHDDLLSVSLGDIADTKAEYYINLQNILDNYSELYFTKKKGYELVQENEHGKVYKSPDGDLISASDLRFPFYAVAGNHDITHNGWALFSSILHSSTYIVPVQIGEYNPNGGNVIDAFIFLDSANGTMGEVQMDLIDEALQQYKNNGYTIRNTFVFTHTNLFRPSSLQFSSTYPREELYSLLNKFEDMHVNIVFAGHVHKWDERQVGNVTYLTLDSMSERNSPEPGDYLVRVHVKADGTISYEKVHMDSSPNK